MPLDTNLQIALQAIQAVKLLCYSSNNRGADLDRVDAIRGQSLGRLANSKFQAVHRDILENLGAQDEPTWSTNLVAPAAVARDIGFGNCEARAALALLHATRSQVRPLELFSVGDDHVFLVIGRTQGHALRVAEWNADAVVCDAWQEECYAIGELAQRLTRQPVAGAVGANPQINGLTCEYTNAGAPAGALRDALNRYDLLNVWPG